MVEKAILILTHAMDDCAQLVIDQLAQRKIFFVRFDTEDFQKTVKTVLRLDASGKFFGKFQFPNYSLAFEDIAVVWNRRVHQPDVGVELDYEPELKKWMEEEALWGLNMSFTMFTCPIVNPWEVNERLKFNKLIQMQHAAACGLEIPETCITNDLAEIKEFWNKVEKNMIFKKIRKGLFYFRDGKRMLVHTNRIPEEKMTDENLRRMRFCPMFLQAHIPKKYDVRSVVVGERVFSVAIDSQKIPEAVVDYRTAAVMGRLKDMPHHIIDLGVDVNEKLVAFSKSFGLTFGVIDLVITPDDRIVFLEDNPNGQWAWLEHLTGVEISSAIASHLVGLRVLD